MYIIRRNGFAMIVAIFVLVLIALGGTILLSNASTASKDMGDKYIHAQAEMIALSATEFAVMRAQDFNTSGANCLNELNISVQDSSGANAYNADVTLSYSFFGAEPANNQCNTLAANTNNPTMVLVDVVVTPEANLSDDGIRVVKRSWQKL